MGWKRYQIRLVEVHSGDLELNRVGSNGLTVKKERL